MNHNKKILAVASAGGHWAQLMLLSDAFKHCQVHYITTHLNQAEFDNPSTLSKVTDADLSSKLKLIPLAMQILVIVLRQRPEVVVSTGAAPGFFAVLFAKLIGSHTIWVDSMANFSELSVSGKYASKFCDLCLTQWPELSDGDRVKHVGSLL